MLGVMITSIDVNFCLIDIKLALSFIIVVDLY